MTILDKNLVIEFKEVVVWNKLFSLRIAEFVLKQLEQNNSVDFIKSSEEIRDRVCFLIDENFEEENKLNEEVKAFMDNLEKEGHDFERYKMFPLLKKQLAKKKGIIL